MAKNFIVSTDCAGIIGNVALWKTLWNDALTLPNCKGVEMIGWKWTKSLRAEAVRQQIQVVGIHGPTSGRNECNDIFCEVKMASLNKIFMSVSDLVDQAQGTDYILLHRPTLTDDVVDLLFTNSVKIQNIYIENALYEGDLDKTIELVLKLRERGLRSCLMFDLVHFLREPFFDSPKLTRFDGLIYNLDKLSSAKFPLSIHFPIGTYTGDSLPLSKISKAMWRELSDALERAKPKYIVLENQQKRMFSLFLPKWKWEETRARNKEVVEMLIDEKIL